MGKPWIDITVTIKNGMAHWPGNLDVRITQQLSIAKGDVCNVTNLALGSHTGTHMDGLLHFIRDGQSLDKMPIEATVGPARVIQVRDPVSIKVKHLEPHKIRRGERILFKTQNSSKSWQGDDFDKNFVYISTEAGQYLADKKIQTVGIDYLSIGGFFKDGVETHHAILGAGIWVIEGLNLSKVKPGNYDLVCLPLKVVNSDGAPARAVLRPR